jgi:hypothetical protein
MATVTPPTPSSGERSWHAKSPYKGDSPILPFAMRIRAHEGTVDHAPGDASAQSNCDFVSALR